MNFDLARLKLEIAKLENTPVDLSKLSDVVKMKLLKIKKLYDELDYLYTSNLVKKLTITQKLMKLKRKYLIMIILNVLPLQDLIG